MYFEKASGDFKAEYIGYSLLDSEMEWSIQLYILEDDKRKIAALHPAIVSWGPLMPEPKPLWPAPPRPRRTRKPKKAKPSPLTDKTESSSDDSQQRHR